MTTPPSFCLHGSERGGYAVNSTEKYLICDFRGPSGSSLELLDLNGGSMAGDSVVLGDSNPATGINDADLIYSENFIGNVEQKITAKQLATYALGSIAGGMNNNVASLSGQEVIPLSQSGGLLQATLSKIAAWIVSTFQGFQLSGTGAANRSLTAKLSDQISVKDFGAMGNGTNDDTQAIQNAINYLQSLARGGTLYYPAGTYLVTSTLKVTSSYIRQVGDGIGASLIVTVSDFNTMIVGTNPIVPMVGVDILDVGFYHTNQAVRNSTHLITLCPVQSTFRNSFTNGASGHVNYGGQRVLFDGTVAPGNYNPTSNPALNSSQALVLAAASTLSGYTMGPGAVDLPTEVEFRSIYINGPRMQGWRYGVAIFAGEQIAFTGDYYVGQSTINNIHIEQDSNNKLILETVLESGGYIDAAGQASIYLGGPNGNGTQYIGPITINCNVKGQGGDGQRGIVIDGTARSGSFAQAVRNLKINANVSGFALDGILIAGAVNVEVDSHVWGNSIGGIGAGSGLVIGPSVIGCRICGTYGGGTFGDGSGNQTYGVSIDPASRNVSMLGADLRGNQSPTNGVANADISGNRIMYCPGFSGNRPVVVPTMPASATPQINPYGTQCQVLVFGGSVTNISLNGQTMFGAAVNAPVIVGPDDKISITYSSVPSWIWWPQ
ncbi:glycosyl hydrolase family 28-related protein [Burkholderia sp. GS2Y]|uniref:Glycosyl hydrolase family 28-related protein n=1 Tax=Burkholderia theae TaxID=3143496 RepID=A0ABU9WK39_9BURK